MARVLGIDYGERRIGVASGDTETGVAVAARTIEGGDDKSVCDRLSRLCEEYGTERVIVGLPLNMNGTEGPMAARARRFAATLAERLGRPVELCDERLSSALAERAMLEGDLSRAMRKKKRDKLAAQVILQGYLDRM